MFHLNIIKLSVLIVLILEPNLALGYIGEYFNTFTSFFTKTTDQQSLETPFQHRIPYEVAVVDEKFITEAAKLTGTALSELDSCQQRVVLKLKSDCHRLNDEQLAKMAVHLLNCQSYVEGRKIYPCSDEMKIKDCTKDMDSDTWTTYHLMSNRARAVCYTIRQSQFRGLAEHTVNRLMGAAQDQLETLEKLKTDQELIIGMTENTFNVLSDSNDKLSRQQEDLQKAQFHGQLVIEGNIKRLADEKRLIAETHNQILEMTKKVQEELHGSTKQIALQNDKSRTEHKQLLDDLLVIEEKTRQIFDRIEKQNDHFRKQYQMTLHNLSEMNKTIHNLVVLMGSTRKGLEERLSWVTERLGGTGNALERLSLIVSHFLFILISMLICAFLSTDFGTRLVVAAVPPLNLGTALMGHEHFDIFSLTIFVVGLAIFQYGISVIFSNKQKIAGYITWRKNIPTPTKSPVQTQNYAKDDKYKKLDESKSFSEDMNDYDFYPSPTPPLSVASYSKSRSRSNTPSFRLNGSLRHNCLAKTKLGTACKMSCLPGRDFCYRHQNGDSILK